MPPESTSSIMEKVGQRIRWRRESLGLSQKTLALALGVTSQQIQKYEVGSNMISAARLYHASEALKVPLSFFFEDLCIIDQESILKKECDTQNIQDNNSIYYETSLLIKAFLAIRDPNMRSKILGLTQDLACL